MTEVMQQHLVMKPLDMQMSALVMQMSALVTQMSDPDMKNDMNVLVTRNVHDMMLHHHHLVVNVAVAVIVHPLLNNNSIISPRLPPKFQSLQLGVVLMQNHLATIAVGMFSTTKYFRLSSYIYLVKYS